MEQKAVLLETQYFPNIQYFSKIVSFSEVLLEQYENYSKGSYRNRCHIAGPNGLLRLSIPLKKGKNEQMNIRAVRIAFNEPWQKQHLATIKTAYGNAPFFEHYIEEIAPIFTTKEEFLFDYNWMILEVLTDLIQVDFNIGLTKTYQTSTEPSVLDFRNRISPKTKLPDTDPDFKAPEYPQVFLEKNGFLANLSILDLLFCTGPQTSYILEKCTS